MEEDLVSGLIGLGYRAKDVKPLARQIAQTAPTGATVEDALTRALRHLNKLK